MLLIALCLVSCLSPAHAAGFNGQSYVPLADWARANGLRCFWLKRGDEIVATNRTTRLVFDKYSRMAEVNGINVALSFPVALDRGVLLIAQMDLNSTIRPLLFFPGSPTPNASRPSASTPATAARTRATTRSGTVRRPTHWHWRWNCATSSKRPGSMSS